MTIAIHESSGQDITLQIEVAFALVTGGANQGKGIHAYWRYMKILINLNDQGGGW